MSINNFYPATELLNILYNSASNELYTLAEDRAHHDMHQGNYVYFTKAITLASGSNVNYLIVIPSGSTPCLGYEIHSVGVTRFECYEATDHTGSAVVTMFNRNRNIASTGSLTVYSNPAGGTTSGTIIFDYIGGYAQAVNRVGMAAGSQQGRLLKEHTSYIFKVESGTADNNIALRLDFEE